MKTAALIAGIALTISHASAGQAPAPASPRTTIRATGEAVVSARPDQARLALGVVTQAATAQAAAAQNAKQLEEVLAQPRKRLGDKAEIRTSGYALTPEYRYPRDGGRPEITGYTASNTIEIRTRDLADVGAVIDAAVQSGANTIHGLHFLLRDDRAVRAQALQEATRKARAHAEAMADAAGLKIVRVLSIEQGEAAWIRPVRELRMAAAAEVAAPPTPIEPGGVEVRVNVTLTAEAAP